MVRKHQNIETFLREVELALENARNTAAIRELLAIQGYGEQRLEEGLALYSDALGRARLQEQERGEMLGAGQAQAQTGARAFALYQAHLAIARKIFAGNVDASEQLGLAGRRGTSVAVWLGQARQFYNALQRSPALRGQLVGFGLSEEAILKGQAEVEALADASERYARERGEALAATVERDAALARLRTWFGRFATIARVALRGHPGHLDMLGL